MNLPTSPPRYPGLLPLVAAAVDLFAISADMGLLLPTAVLEVAEDSRLEVGS